MSDNPGFRDLDELVIPFVLWYMWKLDEILMEDRRGSHTKHPLYSLFVMPPGAEALINSRFIKVNHEEEGFRQFEITEEGKRYCEALFGNRSAALS
jgi:predicted transcriptional regulator with HTH domain